MVFFLDNKFPTLDDSKDVSVDSKSSQLSFDFIPIKFNWFILILPVVWLVLMVFHSKLNMMPVVMGNVNDTLVFKAFDVMFSKLGFLWILLRFVGLIVSIVISSFFTIFFHATWVHVFSNIFLYGTCVLAFIYYRLDLSELFKRFFLINGFVISIVWFICYFVGSVFESMGITRNWLVELRVSDIPVVGASVGLFGLLGYLLIVSVKNVRVKSINFVLMLTILVASFGLLGTQVTNYMDIADHVTKLGATTIFTVILHFVGYFVGLIFGWQNRYRF